MPTPPNSSTLALKSIGSGLRKARGLRTQDELSKSLDVPQSVLSRVENGKYEGLTVPMILRLCVGYGAEPSTVLAGLDHCAVIAQHEAAA